MSDPVTHYKKLGLRTAWCGAVPEESYSDWDRVSCPGCRRRGEAVHGDTLPPYRR